MTTLFQCPSLLHRVGTRRLTVKAHAAARTFIRRRCALRPSCKFMVGYAQNARRKTQRDLTAEQAAERPRAVSDIRHFANPEHKMNLKEKTRALFAEIFGYPATHTIQAPSRQPGRGEHNGQAMMVSFCPALSITRP